MENLFNNNSSSQNVKNTVDILTEIWCLVLKINKVDIEDNFFDIGGNSILVMEVQSKLNKYYFQKITIPDLFAYPTIKGLADYIEQIS